MSAVERLQAAIEKLEQWRWLVGVPPIVRWHDQETAPGWDGFIVIGDSGEEGDDCNPVARVYTDDLAEMLIGLHRTIDAQLSWLRDQHARMVADLNQDGVHIHYRHSLALADAILGDQS